MLECNLKITRLWRKSTRFRKLFQDKVHHFLYNRIALDKDWSYIYVEKPRTKRTRFLNVYIYMSTFGIENYDVREIQDMISSSLYKLPTGEIKDLLKFDSTFTLNPYDDKTLTITVAHKCQNFISKLTKNVFKKGKNVFI